MELKLKAYQDLGPTTSLYVGIMTIFKNEIVEFKESDNCKIHKDMFTNVFPVKRSFYSVSFLDKYHIDHKAFQASIQIENSILVYVKLNQIQKFHLKWILRKFDLQSDKMKFDFYKYIIGGTLGVLFTIITQEVNQRYKADPEIPPKAGIQKSLEHKNLKKNDK